MKKTKLLIFHIFVLWWLLGCANVQSPDFEATSYLDRQKTHKFDDITVTVSVLSDEESFNYFGVPIGKYSIQPVWVRIQNESTHPAWFFPITIDRNYFSPIEVAQKFTKKYDDDLHLLFRNQAIHYFVKPGKTIEGFVYTHQEFGLKKVTLELVTKRKVYSKNILVQVPGLKLDDESLDHDTLTNNIADNITSYAELRKKLEVLPCCASTFDGGNQGDPLNIAFIGEYEELVNALILSGWDETEVTSAGSILKTVKAYLKGEAYANAIVSPLHLFGRHQDMTFQRPRKSISARNHLRLWMTNFSFSGKQVWIGQISRDIGLAFSFKVWPPFTHRIDPDTDDARMFLLEDLLINGLIESVGFTEGVGKAEFSAPRYNLAGHPYFTDGLRLLMALSTDKVVISDIHLHDWEWPPEISISKDIYSINQNDN